MEEKEKNDTNYRAYIEESAEDLYENAPCGYFSYLPDGTVVKINNTLLQWLGFKKSEVLQLKKFQDLLSIGGKIFYETHICPLLKMQSFANEINYDFVRNDSSKLPVLVNSAVIRNNDEKIILYRSTVFNITDRKKYEVELLKAKKRAEEASAAKAEFLSTISHEIRTPMNAIIGVANLLLSEDHTPKQEEYLKILKTSSDNLLNLVNDILDFSKIESGKLTIEEKNFNLRELVNSLLFSLGLRAEEKGLEVKVEMDSSLPEFLKGDPVKISQVLTNLIGNAIKFTKEGFICIKVILKSLTNQKAHVYFEVEDTGKGISPEKISKIFEEFTQESYDINLLYGGTGLGLTISQKLLGMFGSKIEVDSKVDKGSKFFFNLTLSVGEKDQDEIPAVNTVDQEKLLKGVCLLLVEDNPVNVFIVSQYFNHWNIDFKVAEDGISAIEMVSSHNFDLVLMDLQMPLMNGYEASKNIRNIKEEKINKIPIIALTASARSDIKERIKECGIDDFVSKPFNPKELYQKIAYYAGRTSRKEKVFEVQKEEVEEKIQENEIINLGYFTKIANNNPDKVEKLVQSAHQGFLGYKTAFIQSLEEKNRELFDQIEHKSKMVISILGTKFLESKIKEIELLFEEGVRDHQLWKEKQKELETELDKVIERLKL